MVWLDSVRCQHGFLRGWIFGHEIVIVSVVDFLGLLSALDLVGHGFSFSLFLGKNLVDGSGITFSLFAGLGVLRLSVSEELVMVNSLLVKHFINLLLVLGSRLFLSDLLLAPVSLLHLLEFESVASS